MIEMIRDNSKDGGEKVKNDRKTMKRARQEMH